MTRLSTKQGYSVVQVRSVKTLIPSRHVLDALVLILIVALEPPVPALATPPLAAAHHAAAASKLLQHEAKKLQVRRSTAPVGRPRPPQQPSPVVHEVIPAETLADISARYGTPVAEIVQGNGLSSEDEKLLPGQQLVVVPRKTAPARRLVEHLVRSGDGWRGLSARYGVDIARLRAWNEASSLGLRPGARLRIWIDGEPPPPNPAGLGLDLDPTGLNLKPIPTLAFSAGTPNRGRLLNGAQLPLNSKLYWRRRPEYSFGSTHMVKHLQLALAKFRKASQYPYELIISDMSRQHGGGFGRHESHRSGRDVDIWLPRTGEVEVGHGVESARQVDWPAAWQLVKALIRTGQVRYIFLSRSRQRHLFRAASADGLSRDQLAQVMQYRGHADAIVRHEPGHTKHLHARFTCAPNEQTCR